MLPSTPYGWHALTIATLPFLGQTIRGRTMSPASFRRCLLAGSITMLLGWLPIQTLLAQPRPAPPADPFGAPAAANQPVPAPSLEPRRSNPRQPSTRATAAVGPGNTSRSQSQLPSGRERIERELERATNIDVVEMPLKDVVIFLSETHSIPLRLNLKKLEAASVSPDVPITTSLKNISLAAALDLVLSDLELGYYTTEVLVITTQEDAAAQTEVRVYDCRDLLAGQAEGEVDPARVPLLLEAIQSNVMPATWRDQSVSAMGSRPRPSPPGSISEFDGLLIVTQTMHVHRKVENLLNMLREAGGREHKIGRVVR